MDARTAADLWFAIASYEVYDLLTGPRRWSGSQYETWIARTLESVLTWGSPGERLRWSGC